MCDQQLAGFEFSLTHDMKVNKNQPNGFLRATIDFTSQGQRSRSKVTEM